MLCSPWTVTDVHALHPLRRDPLCSRPSMSKRADVD